LCARCHDLIDRRLGVSDLIETERQLALLKLEKRAPEFWRAKPQNATVSGHRM